MSYFDSLRHANIERQAEYDPHGRIGLLFRSNELAGEVGELCNKAKKLERERLGLPGSRIEFAAIEDELGDVLIALDLLAMELGIDLSLVTHRKFNATSSTLFHEARLRSQFQLSAKDDIIRTQIYLGRKAGNRL